MPTRSGPPAHQNREAWIPNRADKQNTLKKVVEALPNQGVCQRCYEQIEWKKQYGKYKPLKQPAKCVGCGRRNVEHSYHTLCKSCARDRNACAKCAIQAPKPPERASDSEALERLPSADELAEMNERQRRSALRKVEKAKAARKQRERDAAEAAGAIPWYGIRQNQLMKWLKAQEARQLFTTPQSKRVTMPFDLPAEPLRNVQLDSLDMGAYAGRGVQREQWVQVADWCLVGGR